MNEQWCEEHGLVTDRSSIFIMVLYVIGLGLGDEKDITVKGLETIQKCDEIYLEYYTSILGIEKSKLEDFYKKSIILADRNMVESQAELIYQSAKEKNV